MMGRQLLTFACLTIILVVAGCGGGGSPASSPPPAVADNVAPTISGTPPVEVLEGAGFAFTPMASDADGDSLAFEIQNRPSWASFSTVDGTLSGTPNFLDQGTYTDIIISVNDGDAQTAIPAFDVVVIDVFEANLQGIVTDAPLAGANVTAFVGDLTLSASTDGQGHFSLPLRVPAADLAADELLTLRAVGDGPQAQIELIAQVADVGTLKALADTRAGQVTLADEPRLAVTHVSTARFLLALDANDGAVPADVSALERAERAVAPERLIETAAVVRLINDDALLPIPDGQTSLELLLAPPDTVRNATRLIELLADAGLADEDGIFLPPFRERADASIDATLGDPLLTVALSEDELIGTVTALRPSVEGRASPTGAVYRFDAGVSGRWYGETVLESNRIADGRLDLQQQADFEWLLDGAGELSLRYADDVLLSFFDSVSAAEANGFPPEIEQFLEQNIDLIGGAFIQYVQRVRSEEWRVVSRLGDRLAVRRSRHVFLEIDEALTQAGFEGDLPRVESVEHFYDDVVLPGPMSTDAFANLVDTTWALPLIYAPTVPGLDGTQHVIGHDVLTLLADGTTSPGRLGALSHEWRVTEEGILELHLEERRLRFRLIEQGEFFESWELQVFEGAEELTRTVVKALRLPKGSVSLSVEALQLAPPFIWQSGVSIPLSTAYSRDGRLDPELVSGFLLRENGVFGPVFENVSTCFELSVPCFGVTSTPWRYELEGSRLQAMRENPDFLELDAYEVLAITEQYLLAIEWGILGFSSPDVGDFSIAPRLTTVERLDLSAYPPEYEQALSLSAFDF